MNDLISRSKLLETMRQKAEYAMDKYCSDDIVRSNHEWIRWNNILNERLQFLLEIETAPSVEPEIIHCRDCKYYDGRPCGIVNWYNTESDFCCRAERRTNE